MHQYSELVRFLWSWCRTQDQGEGREGVETGLTERTIRDARAWELEFKFSSAIFSSFRRALIRLRALIKGIFWIRKNLHVVICGFFLTLDNLMLFQRPWWDLYIGWQPILHGIVCFRFSLIVTYFNFEMTSNSCTWIYWRVRLPNSSEMEQYVLRHRLRIFVWTILATGYQFIQFLSNFLSFFLYFEII